MSARVSSRVQHNLFHVRDEYAHTTWKSICRFNTGKGYFDERLCCERNGREHGPKKYSEDKRLL